METSLKTTLDGLLNRRLMLEQPAEGYRVAIDTVFLAAAIPGEPEQRVLDLGCGVGGAMLCLAARVPNLKIAGVDIQAELVELCRNNIARNTLRSSMNVMQGDATCLPGDFRGSFNHVMMNPPYHDEARHDVSVDTAKRIANHAKAGDLVAWITSAANVLKADGMLTLIHRADHADEITAALARFFDVIELLPLLPKEGASAKRIIIRAGKSETRAMKHCKPLVLHGEQGGYTDAAEAILRHMKALEFRSS